MEQHEQDLQYTKGHGRGASLLPFSPEGGVRQCFEQLERCGSVGSYRWAGGAGRSVPGASATICWYSPVKKPMP